MGRTSRSLTPGSHPFALGLGANLGPMEATLREAARHLTSALGPLTVASLYRSRALAPPGTEPERAEPGPPADPDYLNTVVLGETAFAPEEVLAIAKQVEQGAGRKPAVRWAPRVLDIDLLLLGDKTVQHPELVLPHPGLTERRFVLAPLAEIAPTWRVPPGGRTVAEWLIELGDKDPIERVAGPERWLSLAPEHPESSAP